VRTNCCAAGAWQANAPGAIARHASCKACSLDGCRIIAHGKGRRPDPQLEAVIDNLAPMAPIVALRCMATKSAGMQTALLLQNPAL